MTRDYRHGHGQKQAFQRKSQKGQSNKEGASGISMWGVGIVISIGFVLVFFVANHFISQSNKPLEAIEQKVFQATTELKETLDLDTSPSVTVPSQVKVAEGVVSDVSTLDEAKSNHENTSHHYSFYHGLSQTEVVVEAELISVALTQPYYIQAGSFGSEKVANQEQRRLAKHGQSLTVSALTKGSRTYYRLRMGPFKDRLIMNKTRNELRKLGVDTLLIKASN